MSDDWAEDPNDSLPEFAGGWRIPAYRVMLLEVGPNRVGVMQALRSTTSLTLDEVKGALDNLPNVVLEKDYGEQAFTLTRRLVDLGATPRLVERSYEVQPGCYAGDASAPRITRIRVVDIPRRLW